MNIEYRVYADGSIYNKDDFDKLDHTTPYLDDFTVVSVPDIIVEHIENEVLGK